MSDRLFMGLLVAGGSNLVIPAQNGPALQKQKAPHHWGAFCRGADFPAKRNQLELIGGYSSSAAAFSSSPRARLWPIWPAEARIACSMLWAISGLAARKVLAASRPWPMREPS